jgi:hypothetical protein
MLFGAPFSQGRSFPELFWKKKAQHAHHIFCQFTSEYYRDSRACVMLCIAYQQARLDASVTDLVPMSDNGGKPLPSCLFKESLFNTKEVQRFQYFFDRYCEYAFKNCMNQYNDYSQSLICPKDFTNYLELSKSIFPDQWSFLRATRGIQARDGDDQQEYKERQIFMVLLNLQRLANCRVLRHWAMVISTAFMDGVQGILCLMQRLSLGSQYHTAHVTTFSGNSL